MYTSNNNIFSKRILLFFFFFFFYLETQQHQTKIVERYSIRSYGHSPKCFTPLGITNASPSLGKTHARGKEARISPLGLKSKIDRHRFLAHVANDPATKVSRINDWQRRYKRRGKNPGEQPGLISQAKQDRRARTLMKTNRDDVRGTHAAIYSSTNGLARVSPPLFLPPGSGVSSLQGRKILSMETRTEENDGELLLPYGAFVCIHPAHPPLLSSPLLEKARPFSVEQGETWQKRGGRRSAYAKRAYPRLCQPFFLPQRGTLTLFVHTCAPIQRGFFRGTHEPERRLGNLGERTSLGMPAVVGGGGPGVRAGLYN